MENTWLLIGAGTAGLGILLILIGAVTRNKAARVGRNNKKLQASYEKMMQENMLHIFSKEFHEELRNKARLDFQKVINENAMFLQQDLRLTTAELNEFMKKEASQKLQEQFKAYEESIKAVEQMAVEAINNTVHSAQDQQVAMTKKLQEEVTARKTQMIVNFEQNMTDIVSHYVQQTVGDQVDLNEQLPVILKEMEANKEAMKKDMLL